MNRVIKFRAWTGKQMLYQDKQYLGSFIRRAVLQINLDNARGFQQAHEAYLPDGKSIDDYLMLFTGLTDKNGKDIYEGDIISTLTRNGEPSGWCGDVKLGMVDLGLTRGDGFRYPYRINGFYVQDEKANPSEMLTERMLTGQVAVIGNMYEDVEDEEVS